MEKLVVTIDKSRVTDSDAIARKIQRARGLRVTGKSRSLIDVEAVDQRAVLALKKLARAHGGRVHPVPKAQLIEPIPTRDILMNTPFGVHADDG